MDFRKFQFRRDTAANWTSVNPVLENGEPALETDTRRRKIGDGVSAWNTLAYSSLPYSTNTNLAENSDLLGATQKAIKAYVDQSAVRVLNFKGNLNCSSNPNYPVGVKSDTYMVSVGGKIGGASGLTVQPGDTITASANNAGGTQAAVGASWFVVPRSTVAAPLTKTDDANVTLALGGSPATSLFAAVSLTLGWSGTLSVARGGTGASDATSARANIGAVGLTGNETIAGNKTFSNGVTFNSNPGISRIGQATAIAFTFDVDSGYDARLFLRTGTSNRWTFGKISSVETGGNAGSDFAFYRYDDSGVNLGAPLSMNRATGLVTAPNALITTLAIGSATVVSAAGATSPASAQHGVSSSSTTGIIGAWANSTIAPQFCLAKSRSSTVGTFAAILSADLLGVYRFLGDDGTALQTAASIDCLAVENFSTSAWGTRIRFVSRQAGSITAAETFGAQAGVGLTFGGSANVFLDADRAFRLRPFSVATLPTVGTANRLCAVSDANAPTYNSILVGGGSVKCPAFDNGTNWTAH